MSLREELEKIISGGASTLGDQVEKIAALVEINSHTIKFLEYRDPNRPFNCFAFALDVVDSPAIKEILVRDARTKVLNIKFGSEFITRLIEKNLVPDEKGGVIIYFKDDNPVHAGKISKGRVTSKWGTDCLWEHDLWEVPSQYGNRVNFYKTPTPESTEKEFIDYSKELESALERF